MMLSRRHFASILFVLVLCASLGSSGQEKKVKETIIICDKLRLQFEDLIKEDKSYEKSWNHKNVFIDTDKQIVQIKPDNTENIFIKTSKPKISFLGNADSEFFEIEKTIDTDKRNYFILSRSLKSVTLIFETVFSNTYIYFEGCNYM